MDLPCHVTDSHSSSSIKVIIEKSRREVSLMGQDTIENVSQHIKNFECFFFKFHIFLIHQNVPQIIETFLRCMLVS